MTISIGDKLPDHQFVTMGKDGPEKVSTSDLFGGRKVVLFAVPGAFTPTCHQNHLPGFLEHFDTIKEKGVDEVLVTAVNDVFVMNAWADATGGKGKIRYLSDGSAEFAKAIGMDMDLGVAGLGRRSKRYSMLVDDGTVVQFNVEGNPGEAETSGAATLLGQL